MPAIDVHFRAYKISHLDRARLVAHPLDGTAEFIPHRFPAPPVHTPQTPHPDSPPHSSFHPQNSIPHTRILLPLPPIPHNSAASASPLPPPWHAPQNSHTQTLPAAP